MTDQTHAAILRAKVNEMYDSTTRGQLSDRQFQVQVLNALYVVADQLDRLANDRLALEKIASLETIGKVGFADSLAIAKNALGGLPVPPSTITGRERAPDALQDMSGCSCWWEDHKGEKSIAYFDLACPIHGEAR